MWRLEYLLGIYLDLLFVPAQTHLIDLRAIGWDGLMGAGAGREIDPKDPQTQQQVLRQAGETEAEFTGDVFSLFLFLFRAAPAAYGSSWARGQT